MQLKLVPNSSLNEAQNAAEEYAANGHAHKTKKTYAWALRDFEKWCSQNGIRFVLPFSPEIVAAWIAQSAKEGLACSSIKIMLAAIAKSHREQGFSDPTKDNHVKQVWKGVKREKGVAPKCQKAPLLAEHVALMVRGIKRTDKLKVRDSAILLVGFAAGLRRSELTQIKLNDVSFSERGAIITLRKSKTDQEGLGRAIPVPRAGVEDVCPVTALEKWLLVKPSGERIFPVCVNTIRNVIKRRAKAVGIDPAVVSGHSLRAGMVTSAVRAGKAERAICKITGHRDLVTLRGYIRQGELWRENANGDLLK